MPDVLIRDLDEDVVERIKERAESHGRSLQSELKMIVERNAKVNDKDFWKSADEFRQKLESETSGFSDSAKLLREDRNR